jgi:hypothetical protein
LPFDVKVLSDILETLLEKNSYSASQFCINL